MRHQGACGLGQRGGCSARHGSAAAKMRDAPSELASATSEPAAAARGARAARSAGAAPHRRSADRACDRPPAAPRRAGASVTLGACMGQVRIIKAAGAAANSGRAYGDMAPVTDQFLRAPDAMDAPAGAAPPRPLPATALGRSHETLTSAVKGPPTAAVDSRTVRPAWLCCAAPARGRCTCGAAGARA